MRHINSVIAKRKTVLTMANEKRLIDLSALGIGERNPNAFNNPERAYSWNDLLKILETALTVDAVEVVRCRDCIHAVEIEKDYISNLFIDGTKQCELGRADTLFGYSIITNDGFCDSGERKDGDSVQNDRKPTMEALTGVRIKDE